MGPTFNFCRVRKASLTRWLFYLIIILICTLLGMTQYYYTHNDGRTGYGHSTWAAIVAAIGPEATGITEANNENNPGLPELNDPIWEYVGAEGVHRNSEISIKESGDVIGSMDELYD